MIIMMMMILVKCCDTLFTDQAWPVTDTDSVLCTHEDRAILQNYWNTSTAITRQLRL